MTRVWVGNVPVGAQERDLEDAFNKYGRTESIWVARNPAGFAFVTFADIRDAEDAVAGLDGKNGWKVELARPPRGGGDRGGRGGDFGGGGGDRFGGGGGRGGGGSCYVCGEPGHFARECPSGGAARGGGGGDRYESRGGGGGGRYDDRSRDRGYEREAPRYSDRGGDRDRDDRGGDRGGRDERRDRSPARGERSPRRESSRRERSASPKRDRRTSPSYD